MQTDEKDPFTNPRPELEKACNGATNSASPILAKALSFFPYLADKFIETQEYATLVMGYRSNWFNVTHKKDRISSLALKSYKKNETENLDEFGYSGKPLISLIATIQAIKAGTFVPTKGVSNLFPLTALLSKEGKRLSYFFSDETKCALKIMEILEFNEKDLEKISLN